MENRRIVFHLLSVTLIYEPSAFSRTIHLAWKLSKTTRHQTIRKCFPSLDTNEWATGSLMNQVRKTNELALRQLESNQGNKLICLCSFLNCALLMSMCACDFENRRLLVSCCHNNITTNRANTSNFTTGKVDFLVGKKLQIMATNDGLYPGYS